MLKSWYGGILRGDMGLLVLLALTFLLPNALSSFPAAAAASAPDHAASPQNGPASSPFPDVTPSSPAVRGGPRPDLVLFFAGQVTGWTEPCG